jgi:hypothetical protein
LDSDPLSRHISGAYRIKTVATDGREVYNGSVEAKNGAVEGYWTRGCISASLEKGLGSKLFRTNRPLREIITPVNVGKN